MTRKQKWLLDRLLVPVGIIPPTVTYEDFPLYDRMRKKIGNRGYEYFYMLDQDPNQLSDTSVAGKIYALHAPWQGFPPIEHLPEPIRLMARKIIMGDKEISHDLKTKMGLSFEFAKTVGAKIIVCHISFFNHEDLRNELGYLADLEKKYSVQVAIEHEANYIAEDLKNGVKYLKINESYEWMTNPKIMITTLRKIYPDKKFGICLDSGALLNFGLPLVNTVRPILNDIIHFHLAGNPLGGDDLALEITDNQTIALVRFLYENQYKGYITAEIAGAIGNLENKTAILHTLLGVARFRPLKKIVIGNALGHLENSCKYLLDNI